MLLRNGEVKTWMEAASALTPHYQDGGSRHERNDNTQIDTGARGLQSGNKIATYIYMAWATK